MTVNETEFLYNVNLSQALFVNKYIKRLQTGLIDQQLLEKVKIVLVEAMVDQLEYYYRDTCTGDLNYCTVAEIQTTLNKANRILGSTHLLPV